MSRDPFKEKGGMGFPLDSPSEPLIIQPRTAWCRLFEGPHFMKLKRLNRSVAKSLSPFCRNRRAQALAGCMMESLENRRLLSGTWTSLSHGAPGGLGTMMLLPDGTVFAPINGTSSDWARLTPDSSGSYINGTWSRLASSRDTRLYDASQVLQDGRVFVAGGEYGTGAATGEVYTPLTNTWTALPSQPYGNFLDSGSILLPNGKVLISPVSPSPGGFTTLFNPATNTWSQGPKLFRDRKSVV